MPTIRERILARPDLQPARLARDIDALAAGLNTECVPTLIPARFDAYTLMAEHPDKMLEFVQRVADGVPAQDQAIAILSMEGVEILVDGFEPPMVTRWDVNDAMFNPDGSEK